MVKITLQDIADKIGVSRLTISKVLNNKPGVSDKTRQLVQEALITYNYKNLADYSSVKPARPLRLSSSVGILIRDEPANMQWSALLETLQEELGQAGLNVTMFELGADTEHDNLLKKLLGSRLNCLLVLQVYDEALLSVIRQSGIPAIYLESPWIDGRLPGDLVVQRDRAAARYMTGRLLEGGIASIGFMGDIRLSGTAHERWLGFNDALSEAGADVYPGWCFTEAPGHFETLKEVSSFINSCKSLPQVVFCTVDRIALNLLEALSYCKDQGADTVLVVTFGHLHHQQFSSRGAANAFISSSVLARRLCRQALKRIEEPDFPFEIIAIEPQVNIREHLLRTAAD